MSSKKFDWQHNSIMNEWNKRMDDWESKDEKEWRQRLLNRIVKATKEERKSIPILLNRSRREELRSAGYFVVEDIVGIYTKERRENITDPIDEERREQYGFTEHTLYLVDPRLHYGQEDTHRSHSSSAELSLTPCSIM